MMPPMEGARKPAWGPRTPGVGGANGAPPGRGDGAKRQSKDPMGANMGARKPHDGAGRRGASKNDGYSEEVSHPRMEPPLRTCFVCRDAREPWLC